MSAAVALDQPPTPSSPHRDRYEPLFGMFPTTRLGIRHEQTACTSVDTIGGTCRTCVHVDMRLDVHSGRHRWATLETWVRTLATMEKYTQEAEAEASAGAPTPDKTRAAALGGNLAVAYRTLILGPAARQQSNIPELVDLDSDRYRTARATALHADQDLHGRLTRLVFGGAGVRMLRAQVIADPPAPDRERGRSWWLVVPAGSANVANPSVIDGLPVAARTASSRVVLIDHDLLAAMAGRTQPGEYAPRQRARSRDDVPSHILELALNAYETSDGIAAAPTFSDLLHAVVHAHA